MNLADAIKKCAIEAFDATLPCDVVFGIVVKCDPLEIRVGEMNVKGDILTVSKHLEYKEYNLKMGTYDRTIVINEGIKDNDIVVVLRKSGGENYIVVAKI